jgi:hypothetical protein
MKGDFTRFTFRPQKHFRNVNHQQGRVGLDADWNEQAEIAAYRDETEAQDVIGSAGAPKHKAGFAITPASGTGDFTIGAGRFYVDGILCENEDPLLFSRQPDLPGVTPLATGHRYLIYLDAWQRHLTALDDPEIREVALGGPDTATRTKTVWQVKALDVGNVGANVTCATDLTQWTNAISASTGKLRARAMPDAQSDKPCIVPPGAGYRRLENQFYRVEIHAAGSLGGLGASAPTFKWSRENGSVTAGISSITGAKITLTSFRRDSALGFAPGNWIEITDAGKELRGEPGVLVRIDAVDDLVLIVDQTSAVGTYPTNPLTPSDLALLPKIRRWESAGAVAAAVPSTNDGFLALEDGVEAKFEAGSYRTGDYWMFPARTDKGTVEWPQDNSVTPNVPVALLPFGIRHHFCRLAVIEVKAGVVTLVEDCRRLFPPLTELEDCCGCCTKTVGETDAADYRSIQEAVDSLPATGGQICVLDGSYSEHVVIAKKRDIIIIGCGRRSRLSPRLENGVETGPIIQIEQCVNIRLEKLSFQQGLRSAVAVFESEFVTIFDCEIAMKAQAGSEPALFFQAHEGLIERNIIAGRRELVVIGPVLTTNDSAATARADGTSSTAVSANQSTASGTPASGIQLAGGCRRVRVLENWIYLVRGQGITFGHLEEAPMPVAAPTLGAVPQPVAGRMVLGRWRMADDSCADCKEITNKVPIHPSQTTPQPTHQIISPESLWDIHIERNQIEAAGLDGIGVIGFFDLSKVDEFVRVRGLTILGNEITDCLNLPHEPIAADWVDRMAYGGIALADVSELVVYDNVIERNGAKRDQPACGIFVLHGDGIDIERNRILGNGYQRQSESASPAAVSLGRQGGLQIVYALAPAAGFSPFNPSPSAGGIAAFSFRRPNESTGFPALKIHDNIISAPVGPALSATALGPVSVVGNQLTTGHVNKTDQPWIFAPATVQIFNLGVSNEQYAQILFAIFASPIPAPAPGLDDQRLGQRLAGGNILFSDNQCSLDLLEPGTSGILFSSITLASLDDIAFLNNQCDCNLGYGEDYVVAHTLIIGRSVRVIGNRLKEGSLNAMFSGMSLGHFNITAHNQATHCLMVTTDAGGQKQDGPNMILVPTYCRSNLRETAVGFADAKNKSL